jgi:8-oxo-dGTP diphosphatase
LAFLYKYPRAALTVDAIIVTDLETFPQLLLIKRGQEPFEKMWALPGGFVNLDETLEESCRRELFEETGLSVKKLIQFKTYDAIYRDPRHRTISVVFYAFIEKKEIVKGMDDASDADWFPIDNLPPLAFDHSEIINDFFKKLKQ